MENIDVIKSLMQKAIRRGHAEIAKKCAFILCQNGLRNWVRIRLGVILFEDAYIQADKFDVFGNQSIYEKIDFLANCVKSNEAAGIAGLASMLISGRSDILIGSEKDKHIKNLADILRSSDEFWLKQLNLSSNHILYGNSYHTYKAAAWDHDKNMAIAGHYLIITDQIEPEANWTWNQVPDAEFEYYCAIDKHTRYGKSAFKTTHFSKMGITVGNVMLSNILFYYEGSRKQKMSIPYQSYWEKLKYHNMRDYGLTTMQAATISDEYRPIMIEQTKEMADWLKNLIESTEIEEESSQGGLF